MRSVSAAALATALAATGAQAIVSTDEVGTDGAVDAGNDYPAVGQLVFPIPNSGGFIGLCTGTLINPRTVITAAHCFGTNADGTSTVFSEGNPEVFAGSGIPLMISFDVNTLSSIQNWFASGFQTGGGAYTATDILVHPDNSAFPNNDIAMFSIDTPIDHIDPMALLLDLPPGQFVTDPGSGSADFFPDDFIHAVIAGYGNAGTGSQGITIGVDFNRRIGENTVPAAFFFGDFAGDPTPPLWIFDFDDPIGDVFPVDVLGDGGALPNEAGTAPGDSGGPLIFDELAPFPLVAGILSGGGSLGPVPNGYGDFSIYPILALASDWIIANNPYKYVSALGGSGDWMDPNHWVQELDPGYYIFATDGSVVNGVRTDLPTLPDPGASSGATETGGELDATPTGPALIYNPGFIASTGLHLGHGGPTDPTLNPLTGPGSTNFVPNNTDGAPSGDPSIEGDPAQYFDVNLFRRGTTWLNDTVEIDRLTKTFGGIDHYGFNVPNLWIRRHGDLTVNLDAYNYVGALRVDGSLTARAVFNGGEGLMFAAGGHGLFNPAGVLSGNGVISVSDAVYNLSGITTAGRLGRPGQLTINGDYVQGSDATLWIDVRRRWRSIRADLLTISGSATLAGDAIVAGHVRFGDSFTVIDASSVSGDFDDVDLLFSSAILFARSEINAAAGDVDIIIDARPFRHYYGHGHSLASLASALDSARWGGGYSSLTGVFDLVDSQGLATLDFAMTSLTPQTALEQTASAAHISNSFRSHLTLRGAELRAGSRGVSGGRYFGANTTVAGAPAYGAAAAITPGGPGPAFDESSRFGVFIAGDGALNRNDETYRAGFGEDPFVNNISATGDLAVGVDVRLTDNLAFGVAALSNRYELAGGDGVTPLRNESYGAAAYGTAYGEQWFVDGYFGVSHQDYDTERGLPTIDGDLAVAIGAPTGQQSVAGVRAGWSFEPLPGLTVSPTTSLDVWNVEMSGYSESAGGAFNLEIEGRELTSISVANGVEMRWFHQRDTGGAVSAFGRFDIVNELGDGVDIVSAHFADAPAFAFDIERDLDREWYSASTGVAVALSETFSARVELNSDLDRGDLSSHAVSVGLNWRF